MLPTELIASVGHREEFKSRRFERQPFVRAIDQGLMLETSAFKLFTVANLIKVDISFWNQQGFYEWMVVYF